MTAYSTELSQLFGELAQETEKVAEAQVEVVENDDAQVKLAEDLYAGGGIMANGFVDQILEKLAMGIPAAGGGSAVPIASPRSRWEQAAAKLAKTHGRGMTPGDDTSVRAEDGSYPGSGQNTAKGGAKGSVNTQKDLN